MIHPRKLIVPTLLLVMNMIGIAGAQQPSSSAANPNADQRFVEQIGAGGMAEVELSQLALTNSSSTAVRSFALHMIEAHRLSDKELALAAKASNLIVSTEPDSGHIALQSALTTKQGTDFDHAYMEAMRRDHERMVGLLQEEALTTDVNLRAFAIKTLPAVQLHLQMAMKLNM